MPDKVTCAISEKSESRRGKAAADRTSSIDYTWRIRGSDSIPTMLALLHANKPPWFFDPVWGQVMVPQEIAWERVGYELHDFTVVYGNAEAIEEQRALDIGEARFMFSTSGGTLRIYTSKQTVGRWRADGPVTIPPNKQYGQPIQWDDEGVEGTEVVIPATAFSIEYRLPNTAISHEYLVLLEQLTGTTNKYPFYCRPAGEVLFLGVEGAISVDIPNPYAPTTTTPEISEPEPPPYSTQLRFSFVRSPNLQDIVIGEISNIVKQGHDFLWVQYESEVDDDANKKWRVPREVFVDRVYDSSDFGRLNIGGDIPPDDCVTPIATTTTTMA